MVARVLEGKGVCVHPDKYLDRTGREERAELCLVVGVDVCVTGMCIRG